MANLNKVMLIGRLTRDPELRDAGGTSVCDIGLAINREYRKKDGTEVKETCFVDCTCWGRTAENVAKYLAKGREAYIEGRLQLDQWEKDGEKRSKLKVTVDFVQFLGGRQDSEAPAPAPQPAAAAPAPRNSVVPF